MDPFYYELGDRPVDIGRYNESVVRAISDEHLRQGAPPTAYDVWRTNHAIHQTRSPAIETKQYQFSRTVGEAPKPRLRFINLF